MSIEADAAVPPAARLVRDFVNTVEWQVDRDEWGTPAELSVWFARNTGLRVHDATDDDVRLARRVREGLRAVLLAHAGHDPLPTEIDDLNAALHAVPVRIRFAPAGEVALAPHAPAPLAEPLARILDAIEATRAEGGWSRLKACSRDSCRWAYWDDSRNRSGRWCSMIGCGNYLKMRRRNSGGTAPDETIGRTRLPTMLDVAARAGVSIKTVSNVVTGTVRVAPGTRARVEAAIEQLGYTPNLAARALRTGRRA